MPGSAFLIVGGEPSPVPSDPSEWTAFVAGKALLFDLESGGFREGLRYVTPPEARCPSGDNILFKSASVRGDRLTLVTETEVLSLEWPLLATRGTLSHPWMNDVHHALALGGGEHLVMSTGLDAVLRLDPSGAVTAHWYVGRGRVWDRFDPDKDYRKVRSTQPHHAHANHLALVGDDLWVTRFQDRDALVIPDVREHPGFDELPPNLTRHRFPAGPHDGVARGSLIWFTTVDGVLHGLDALGSMVRTIDLNRAYRHGEELGWCRGLLWISDDEVLVGFSAYRRKRYGTLADRGRARARMLVRKGTYQRELPSEASRIVHFDVSGDAPRALREFETEPEGLRDIFSILPISPRPQ